MFMNLTHSLTERHDLQEFMSLEYVNYSGKLVSSKVTGIVGVLGKNKYDSNRDCRNFQ